MKTTNPFIASVADQSGEMVELIPQDSQTLTFDAPLIPNYTLNGFGTLKWNGSQYEFEGDPHESAKIFAEHLLVRVNAKPDSQTLTADDVQVRREDLEFAVAVLDIATAWADDPSGRGLEAYLRLRAALNQGQVND